MDATLRNAWLSRSLPFLCLYLHRIHDDLGGELSVGMSALLLLTFMTFLQTHK